jgi:hypothetical protein
MIFANKKNDFYKKKKKKKLTSYSDSAWKNRSSQCIVEKKETRGEGEGDK